jgi:hypothetical protein
VGLLESEGLLQTRPGCLIDSRVTTNALGPRLALIPSSSGGEALAAKLPCLEKDFRNILDRDGIFFV